MNYDRLRKIDTEVTGLGHLDIPIWFTCTLWSFLISFVQNKSNKKTKQNQKDAFLKKQC